MKTISTIILLLIICTFVSPLFAIITFEKWFGDTEDDLGFSVAQTSDKGYIITGYTSTNGTAIDVCLIKTDSLGTIIFSKSYGGTHTDCGHSVVQTSDGGYFIGGSTYSFGAGHYDIYLIKTDSLGDTLWTKTYGGPLYDEGYSVIQTSDGCFVVTGYVEFESSFYDLYLAKINTFGDTVWTKTYGGIDWEDGYSVLQTNDGGYLIGGRTQSFGAGGFDFYVVKTDSVGDTLWTRTYGSTTSDGCVSIVQSSDGGYAMVGYTFSGPGGILVIKADSIGDTMWTKQYGNIGTDMGNCIAQTIDGGFIVAGNTYSSGEEDVYLIKINSVGDTIWTKTFGGNEADVGLSVCQTFDGGYIITGYTYSHGAGSSDIYLIKTDSLGNVGVTEHPDQRQETRDIRLTTSPNPFIERVEIRLHGESVNGCIGESVIQIYDASGRLVKSVKLATSYYKLGTDLPPGVYFLKLNGKPVGKVVKVR